MRWSVESWRGFVDDVTSGVDQPDASTLPWGDAPASLVAARVDLVCRAAYAQVGRVPPTVIVGLDGAVQCWWSTAMEVTAPFRAGATGGWLLPAEISLLSLTPWSRRAEPPLQLLVTVGVTPDHRLVLVDLNHWTVMGVQGGPVWVPRVMRALAAGLGAPPLATPPTIWWGGLDPDPDLPPQVGVAEPRRGDQLADAETALEALAVCTSPPAVAVVHGALPDLPPTPGSGRAVITAGRPSHGLWLEERDGLWVLLPHRLDLLPVGVEGHDRPDLSGNPKAKEQHMTTSAETAVSVHRLVHGTSPTRRSPRPQERTWPLMVSVLGSPRVVNHQQQPVEFDRSKALELVVWLALHRPRCTRSGARNALWDLPIRDTSFANIVCDARRRLAEAVTAPPGTEWIARSLGDDLPLHPHVVTDADLLRSALRRAHGNADPVATHLLDEALTLVRGVPFEGTNYLWADAEGLTSELTMLIVQASAALARRHLEAGDLAGVFEATAVGLRVVPRHEELIALRLRAHHRNGDDAGVRQEWVSYERALAMDPFSSRPSTKLLALRQELLRRPVSV